MQIGFGSSESRPDHRKRCFLCCHFSRHFSASRGSKADVVCSGVYMGCRYMFLTFRGLETNRREKPPLVDDGACADRGSTPLRSHHPPPAQHFSSTNRKRCDNPMVCTLTAGDRSTHPPLLPHTLT